jgi:hypothetical protein
VTGQERPGPTIVRNRIITCYRNSRVFL